MDSKRIKTTNLLFNIFIFYGISYSAIDPLIPILSERLKIGYDKIGLILLLSAVFTLFSTYISGRLCDHYNLKKIILFGLLMLFLGFLLFGIVINLVVFIITLLFFRVGQGSLDSSVHVYAAQLYYKEHSPIFLKLDFFWYVGAIIGPLIISLFLFIKLDPRFAFLIFSVCFLVILIFFYKFCPREIMGKIDSDTEYENGPAKNSFSFFGNKIIIISCIVLFLYMGIITGISSWLTTYFTAFNVPVSYSSVVLSFFWCFSALGVFVTGKLIKKGNEVNLLFLSSIIAVVSTITYGLVPSLYLKIFFLMMQAVFYSAFFPLILSITVHENPRHAGMISGFTISFGITGSLVFQPLMGFFTQFTGKGSIAYIMTIAAIFEIIFTSILFRLVRKKYLKKKELSPNVYKR
jgi:fucose permease